MDSLYTNFQKQIGPLNLKIISPLFHILLFIEFTFNYLPISLELVVLNITGKTYLSWVLNVESWVLDFSCLECAPIVAVSKKGF